MDSNNYESNSTWPRDILIVVLILVIGFAGGYFVGQENNKYKTAVDELFPQVESDVYSFSGEIKSISGESFVVETSSFDRQLPGREVKFRTLTVNTNSETSFLEFDTSVVVDPESSEGSDAEIEISFSDLVVGDDVSVGSVENARGSSEITAQSVTRILQPEGSFENTPEDVVEEFPEN